MLSLAPFPQLQFFTNNGLPASGGTVTTYLPNTTTLVATYNSEDGSVFNANPLTLNSAGRCSIWIDQDVQLLIKDSDGNQIYTGISKAALPLDAISDTLAPALSAATFQSFRDISGVTAAIDEAVSAVALMPGPEGEQGIQGVQGVQGVPGVAGAGYIPSLVATSPTGYASFPNANNTAQNIFFQFGTGTTDSGGNANVSFARPFPNSCLGVYCVATSTSWWANPTSYNTTGFVCVTSSPLHSGSWAGGPISFTFFSLGW